MRHECFEGVFIGFLCGLLAGLMLSIALTDDPPPKAIAACVQRCEAADMEFDRLTGKGEERGCACKEPHRGQ